MIELYYRNINQKEIQELNSRQTSTWKKIERVSIKLIAVTLVLLFPFKIINTFFPVSSNNEGLIVIILLIIATAVVIYWTRRDPVIAFENQRKQTSELEVIHCTTKRAIRREDHEDFGLSFYLDTEDGRTLFLQGQYLDVLEYHKQFPNSDFELIRTKETKELVDFKIKGHYFEPEKTLRAFSKEDYKNGDIPEDGEILNIKLEEIK